MKLKMFEDRLFVILDEVQEKKIGSIIVPDNHSERSRTGIVMDVGPGVKDYNAGDKVLVSWYTGTRVHLDGETMFGKPVQEDSFRVVREGEILGLVLED